MNGLILRVVNHGDASAVVTLLGGAEGKRAAYAQGARQSRRRFAGGLDLFTLYRFQLEGRRPDAMPRLCAATVIQRLDGIPQDLFKMAVASCAIESARDTTPEHAPLEDVFTDLWTLLCTLDSAPGDAPELAILALRWFEIRLLSHLGHETMLSHCFRCGQAPDEEVVRFYPDQGGTCCLACYDAGPLALRLPLRLVLGLEKLRQRSLRHIIDGALQRGAQQEALAVFNRDAGRVLAHLLEANLGLALRTKAHLFLEQLCGARPKGGATP